MPSKCRVHLEMIDHKKLRVTNLFYQKDFDLHEINKKGQCIDLVSLTVIPKINDFCAYVSDGNGVVGDPYEVEVSAHHSQHKIWGDIIAVLKIPGSRDATVEVTVMD